MNICAVIKLLSDRRKIFHSEADFQFALAWEIHLKYEDADIRLEYPLMIDTNRYYIDILVRLNGSAYPIELKYKTKTLDTTDNGELYKLKNQIAQDFSSYDFVKDICRIEKIADHLNGFKCGYAIWLTNDSHYWNMPSRTDVSYAQFSVHNNAIKEGIMKWQGSLTPEALKGRDVPLTLKGRYPVNWNEYSVLDSSNKRIRSEVFKYALISVSR